MEREGLDAFADAYVSGLYQKDNELTLAWCADRIIALSQKGSLLELGLGHGITAERLSKHFTRYVVVEGSEQVISQFRASHGDVKVEIVQDYFENFETDERFDAISMGFVLEHVDEPARLLHGYQRFLRRGGAIFIAVPNAESLHRRLGKEAGMLGELTTLSAADHAQGHQRYYTLERIEAEVRDAGLRVMEREGVYLKPFTSSQIEALRLPPQVYRALMVVGSGYPELCNSVFLKVMI